MSYEKRRTLAASAFGVAALAALARPAGAQATAAAVTAWSPWLTGLSDVTKLVELSAFVFGTYQFWAGRRERVAADRVQAERARIDSIYQSWQVINSAQGKGGSGGRIEALADLLANDVSLAGIRLDEAWLEEVQLPGANLVRGSLRRCNLARANLVGANLEGADLTDADLVAADLTGASLRGAIVTGARLSATSLDRADVRDLVGWREIRSLNHASVVSVYGPPAGFLDFAREQGATDSDASAAITDEQRAHAQVFRAV